MFFFGHQFQIDRLNPSWTSSLSLGVIGHSPDRLNFPSTACCLKRSAWLLQRDSVFHNSLKVNTPQLAISRQRPFISPSSDFIFLFHSPPLFRYVRTTVLTWTPVQRGQCWVCWWTPTTASISTWTAWTRAWRHRTSPHPVTPSLTSTASVNRFSYFLI